MQPDTIALIQRLCVIAGTVMEDTALDAISIVSADPEERREHLQNLAKAGEDMAALLRAAAVLDRRLPE